MSSSLECHNVTTSASNFFAIVCQAKSRYFISLDQNCFTECHSMPAVSSNAVYKIISSELERYLEGKGGCTDT